MNTPNLHTLADMKQLEERLDQRLDLINRAEASLRGLYDALRQQVTIGFPLLEELKKTLPNAQQKIDEAQLIGRADDIADAMTERLHQTMEQAMQELRDSAAPVRQQLIDDLRSVVQAAKASVEEQARSIRVEASPVAEPSRQNLIELADAFRAEAQETLDSLRASMIDHLDLMRADARLQVDPILQELQSAKLAADAQLKAAVSAHESAMNARVQQLTRSVDEIAAVLEERLAARVTQLHRRADESIGSIEPLLRGKVDRAVDQADAQLRAGESRLNARITGLPERIEKQLSDAERTLSDRIQRLETHASSMSSYLEQKLSAHVDQLIARLRLKLQTEIADVTGVPAPPTRDDPAPEPQRPTFEVFVNPDLAGKSVAA